jgi:hypothetical protein
MGLQVINVVLRNSFKTYGNPDPQFEYDVYGMDPGDTVTGFPEREPGENAGEYQFGLGTLSAPPKYKITFVPSSFTIYQRPLTITIESKTKEYGEPDPELTYVFEGMTAEDMGNLECELQRQEGEDAGIYAISWKFFTGINTDNYIIFQSQGIFTIEKKDLIVYAHPQEKTYGDSDPVLSYSTKGLVGDDEVSGALAREEGETVGEYDISLGNLTAGDNYNVLFTGAKFNILRREITIEGVSAVDRQYDGTVIVELTGVISGIIEGDDVSLVLTGYINSPNARPEPYNVTTAISLEGADSGNYVFTQDLTGITVTITPQQVVVYWPTETFIYNGSVQYLSVYYYDIHGNIQYPYVEVNGVFKNAGTYTATAVVTTEGPNYQFVGYTKELTIEPLQIEFTYFSIDISRYYNGSDIAQVYYMTNIPYGEDWCLR